MLLVFKAVRSKIQNCLVFCHMKKDIHHETENEIDMPKRQCRERERHTHREQLVSKSLLLIVLGTQALSKLHSLMNLPS